MAIGYYGDKTGFWLTRPFLTNILTATTGACAGIPIAVGIIQRFTILQEERGYWQATLRALDDCIGQMRAAVAVTCTHSASEIEDLYSLLTFCIDRSERLLPIGWLPIELSSSHVDELKRLEVDILQLQAAIKRILPDKTVVSTASTMYNSAWESLDQYVRPRIQELQGRWLDSETYITLKSTGFPDFNKSSALRDLDITLLLLRTRVEAREVRSRDGSAPVHNLRHTKEALDRFFLVRKLLPQVVALSGANK